jgi:bis(5'-nucleosyl)-tetraphosphatase (symmetrical)
VRTIIIGDIHGCITEFRELVDRLNLVSDDRVVCLGDFMDKGPAPAECVRVARERGFRSILGNHDEKHLRWRRHEERRASEPGYKNPMRPLAPEAQTENALLSPEDVAWLRGLPTYLELAPSWLAVHGGLQPGIPLASQDPTKILRLRWVDEAGNHIPVDYDNLEDGHEGQHWTEVYDGEFNVVYGHEAHSLSRPRVDVRSQGVTCYGIDTGVVHGGRLTALVLEDGNVSFVQVQSRRCYEDPPCFIPP